MNQARKISISVLRDQIHEAESGLRDMKERLERLELEQAREKYNCECVNLNEALGIYDMAEQEAAGRVALQLGLVARTFSAKRGCEMCHGSGQKGTS